eukprot:Clim_evm14s230 gene=Clim_evmTU14s230
MGDLDGGRSPATSGRQSFPRLRDLFKSTTATWKETAAPLDGIDGAFKVVVSPEKGRHAIALRNFTKDELVLVDYPIAYSLHPGERKRFCAFCLSRNTSKITVPNALKEEETVNGSEDQTPVKEIVNPLKVWSCCGALAACHPEHTMLVQDLSCHTLLEARHHPRLCLGLQQLKSTKLHKETLSIASILLIYFLLITENLEQTQADSEELDFRPWYGLYSASDALRGFEALCSTPTTQEQQDEYRKLWSTMQRAYRALAEKKDETNDQSLPDSLRTLPAFCVLVSKVACNNFGIYDWSQQMQKEKKEAETRWQQPHRRKGFGKNTNGKKNLVKQQQQSKQEKGGNLPGQRGVPWIGRAVYPLASVFNHSCAPNLVHYMELGAAGFLEIRTARPVAAGEELNINYVDVTLPGKIRRSILEQEYHFVCDCVKCRTEG